VILDGNLTSDPRQIACFTRLALTAETYRRQVIHDFQFLDKRRLRRVVDLELQVPDWHKEGYANELPFIVPIVQTYKQDVSCITISSRDGVRVTLATRHEAYELYVRHLTLLWAEVFDSHCPLEVEVLLRKALLWESVNSDKALVEFLQSLSKAAKALNSQQTVDGKIGRIRETACAGASGDVLLAIVPNAEAGEILRLRLEFTQTLVQEKSGSRRTRAVRWLRRTANLGPDVLAIPAPEAMMNYDVHYQVHPPPGLAVVSGIVRDRVSEEVLSSRARSARPRDNPAHIHMPPSNNASILEVEPRSSTEIDPRLIIALMPDSEGPYRQAVNTAWAMAITSLAVAVVLPLIQANDHSGEVGATYLAGAAGITAIVGTRVDHSLSWKMLRSARWMLLAVAGIVCLTGAMILGVDSSSEAARQGLCDATFSPASCVMDLVTDQGGATDSPLGSLGNYRWHLAAAAFAPALVLSLNPFYWGLRERLPTGARLYRSVLGSISSGMNRLLRRLNDAEKKLQERGEFG
jgi:hypothetical protein